ncbi:DUF2913 family protein [Scandinavium sp. TWS1a]|uniref:DUF2913 family protein n=1 Tax=Scandinavium tedordense TaxID=2926521 RepID=UPI00216524BA|nr:DUF2913 family protein [Scandinavium tedordense]
MQSDAQENLFLTRWLAEARRFPRDTTGDIDWLLKQGRTQGIRAKLPFKLYFLWKVTTDGLADQPDLYRHTARECHWVYRMLSDDQ